MKTKRWQTAGILAVIMLAFFTADVFAQEVDEDAGVKKETMFDLIKKGGPIMWPIGLCSILALAWGLERFIALRKERVLPAGFIDGLLNAWSVDPSGKQAVAYCDESGGAVGHIFKAGVRRAKMGPDAVEKAIEDAGSREADKMKRSLRLLSIIAMISPLLGLLGTVYGMIGAFQAFQTSAAIGGLAEGIYEALVTTAAGLTIAIPVLLLYQFLLGRVDKLIDDIDEAGTEFVFSYTEGHPNVSAGTGDFGGPAAKKDDPAAEKDDPPAATVATAGA